MDAQFNSVFDDAVEVEKTFDTIFGGQEDDELMGIVLGESADDVDFETLDDGITPNELEKELDTPDVDKPTIDSDGEFDIKDKEGGLGDLACDKYGVADAVQKTEPDEENLEGEEEKSEKKVDFEESVDLDKLYEETEEDEAPLPPVEGDGDIPNEQKPEVKEESGDGTCAGCDDKYGEEPSGEKSEIAPNIPDGNAEVVATDTESDVDDFEEVCGGSSKKAAVKEEDDDIDDDEDEDEVEDGGEEGSDPDTSNESTISTDVDLDKLYESEESEEDAIINAVEDDAELSDSELNALINDDNDDDEIIDDVLG